MILPPLLYIGIGCGLLYFLIVLGFHARTKGKLTQGDFYNWGFQSIVFSMGVTNAILMIYFAITGEVYPGGSKDALRTAAGILGIVSLAAACYILHPVNLRRLKGRGVRK